MTGLAQPEAARVRLPANVDLRAAGALTRELLAVRGRPISLDASGVERLGGLGLQVLLSARLTWAADRLDFTLVAPSKAFLDDCALLGASAFNDFSGAAAA